MKTFSLKVSFVFIFAFGLLFSQSGFSSDSCLGVLTGPEETQLSEVVSTLNAQFITAGITAEQRATFLRAELEKMDFDGDPEKAELREAFVALLTDIQSSQIVFELIIERIKGEPISEVVKASIVKNDGITSEDFELFLNEEVEKYRKYYESMVAHGIPFVKGKGWDFSTINFTPELLQDATFNTALGLFISPDFATTIIDPYRNEALVAGNTVFLPIPKRGTREGSVPKMGVFEYQGIVQKQLDLLDKEVKSFLSASKEAATYTNLMSGRIWELFGLGRGGSDDGDMTSAEIEKEITLNQIDSIRNFLIESYGIPAELRTSLQQLSLAVLEKDKENLQAGIAKIDAAWWAVVLAPVVVALVAVAVPAAGALASAGLISTTVSVGVAKATTAMIAIPLFFGIGHAGVSAAIDSSMHGGDWFCRFKEELVASGSPGIKYGAILGSLPLASATGAGLLGAAIYGAPVVAANGAILAPGMTFATTSYGIVNVGTALYFLQSMGRSSVTNFSECAQLLKSAQIVSETSGETELVDAFYSEGMKRCLDGGIDLAFALSIGGRQAKEGYRGFKYFRSKAFEANRYYSVLGLNRNATLKEIKTAYRNLAKKLHPDRGGSHEQMAELNEAYAILSDQSSRRIYDGLPKNEMASSNPATQIQRTENGQKPSNSAAPKDYFIEQKKQRDLWNDRLREGHPPHSRFYQVAGFSDTWNSAELEHFDKCETCRLFAARVRDTVVPDPNADDPAGSVADLIKGLEDPDPIVRESAEYVLREISDGLPTELVERIPEISDIVRIRSSLNNLPLTIDSPEDILKHAKEILEFARGNKISDMELLGREILRKTDGDDYEKDIILLILEIMVDKRTRGGLDANLQPSLFRSNPMQWFQNLLRLSEEKWNRLYVEENRMELDVQLITGKYKYQIQLGFEAEPTNRLSISGKITIEDEKYGNVERTFKYEEFLSEIELAIDFFYALEKTVESQDGMLDFVNFLRRNV